MNRELLPQPAGLPALHGITPLKTGKPPIHLTPRESEIVRFVMLGESNKQIARRLGISNYTVRDHVSNLLKKAGVTSRSRLALVIALPVPLAVHEPVPHGLNDPRQAAARETRPLAVPEAPRDLGALWRTTR